MTTIDHTTDAQQRPGDVVAGSWAVGIDGSDCARNALEWAIVHAPGRATELDIVTAWQVPLYGPYPVVGPATSPYDDRALAEAATRDAETVAGIARDRIDVPVETVVAHGGASEVLLDAAANGALLVVGNRGRGGFARLLLGSTSTQCATHAEVPTVVVPCDRPPAVTRRVVVGVDGSPNSLTALSWAIDFVGAGGAIQAMWVWDASPLAVGADEFFFPDAGETAQNRFDHLVDRVLPAAARRSVCVERSFVRGTPRRALAEAAADADLLVVGARGHGAVGAALLGSVSTWLLHHVDCPTAVVPHLDTGGDDGQTRAR